VLVDPQRGALDHDRFSPRHLRDAVPAQREPMTVAGPIVAGALRPRIPSTPEEALMALAPIFVAPRFCGPPGIGNGGYVAGLLAGRLLDALPDAAAVEVTLRASTPLGRELEVVRDGDGVQLRDGGDPIAIAKPAQLSLDVPPFPARDTLEARAGTCRAFQTHPYRGCFVCGPDRDPGDGLRILPGWHPEDGIAAAPWSPDAGLADASGALPPEFLWAALDCGGSFVLLEDAQLARKLEPMVLGRLTVRLGSRVSPGETLAVGSWSLGQEGRRGRAGTALRKPDGSVAGLSEAVWVSIRGR